MFKHSDVSLKRSDMWLTNGFPQLCERKPKIEMEFSKKGLWKGFLSNGMNFCDIHRRLITFLIILYQQILCWYWKESFGLKGILWTERNRDIKLLLSYKCPTTVFWEHIIYFLSFTGLNIEKNCVLGMDYTQATCIPDLDDLAE